MNLALLLHNAFHFWFFFHHAEISQELHLKKAEIFLLEDFVSGAMSEIVSIWIFKFFFLFKRVSWTVGLFAVTSGLLTISLWFETFVQILASVPVFTETILEEVVAEFCFVFEIEDGFVSDLLVVVGKSTLRIKKELRIC